MVCPRLTMRFRPQLQVSVQVTLSFRWIVLRKRIRFVITLHLLLLYDFADGQASTREREKTRVRPSVLFLSYLKQKMPSSAKTGGAFVQIQISNVQ